MTATINFIRDKARSHHCKEPSGHDFGHIDRVYNTAMSIAIHYEQADKMVLALSSVLHDVADHKFVSNQNKGAVLEMMTSWLEQADVDSQTIEKVLFICQNISYSRSSSNAPLSIEGQIVQDADRLDAIGAIGIARAFAYGGANNRIIYSTDDDIQDDTIRHFYDKLLRVKSLMNTQVAKDLAEGRHKFMEGFLDQFFDECKGCL